MTRLRAALPNDADHNGLGVIHRELMAEPGKRQILLLVVDTAQIVDDLSKNTQFPVLAIHHVEPILEVDRADAEDLLIRAMNRRRGPALSKDLEEDYQRELFHPEMPPPPPDSVVEDSGKYPR